MQCIGVYVEQQYIAEEFSNQKYMYIRREKGMQKTSIPPNERWVRGKSSVQKKNKKNAHWLCIQQIDRWEVKKLLISFKFALIVRSYRLQCDAYGWEKDICKKYYVFNRNAPNCNNNETSVIATKHEGKKLEPFYISSFRWHCIELHYLIESFFTRSSIPMNDSFVRSMARLFVLSLFCFYHLQFFFD